MNMKNVKYCFVYTTVIVISTNGEKLDKVCATVDNAYEPPFLDEEMLELSETEIVAVNSEGEPVYKFGDTVIPDVGDIEVTLHVRNLLEPVTLPEQTLEDLLTYFENAVIEGGDIDIDSAYVDDEFYEVFNTSGKQIKK